MIRRAMMPLVAVACISTSTVSALDGGTRSVCRVGTGVTQKPTVIPGEARWSVPRRAAINVLTGALGGGLLECRPDVVRAVGLLPTKERRQLDLCIVNLLRVKYWAETTAMDFQRVGQEEVRKQLYLESRLGAKALVTGRIGGGSTSRVYTLASLQFRGCLEDLAWYGKSRQVSELAQDLVEALAAMVEFDGLETTTDPSPRSSLMLSMYNSSKETFLRRMLSERVVPIANNLINLFDLDVRRRCEQYIESAYPNEVPKKPASVGDAREGDQPTTNQ